MQGWGLMSGHTWDSAWLLAGGSLAFRLTKAPRPDVANAFATPPGVNSGFSGFVPFSPLAPFVGRGLFCPDRHQADRLSRGSVFRRCRIFCSVRACLVTKGS